MLQQGSSGNPYEDLGKTGGTIIGGAVGGPPGAIIGGALGSIAGSIGGGIIGSKRAKKAARARQRGLNQYEGHLNEYAADVDRGWTDTTRGIQDARDRENLGFDRIRATLGRDRALADRYLRDTSALSRDNLRTIQDERDASLQYFDPYLRAGREASDMLSDIYAGGSRADDAFATFRQNTGYRQQLEENIGRINSAAAARGLRGSGAQQRALADYVSEAANKSFQDFAAGLEKNAGRGADAAVYASRAREAYAKMTVDERREMQTQIQNYIAKYESANATERQAIRDQLDKLADQDNAFRGALTEYLNRRGNIHSERGMIDLERADVKGASIAALGQIQDQTVAGIGRGLQIAGPTINDYFNPPSQIGGSVGNAAKSGPPEILRA